MTSDVYKFIVALAFYKVTCLLPGIQATALAIPPASHIVVSTFNPSCQLQTLSHRLDKCLCYSSIVVILPKYTLRISQELFAT